MFFFFLIYFIYLFFTALGLHCCAWAFSSCGERGLLFVVVCGLPIAVTCCGAWALGTQASVVVACGLSSCGSWALECKLGSCGTWALFLCGMWDLPRPGLEPMFPALAGRFLTTVPPGKPHVCCFKPLNLECFVMQQELTDTRHYVLVTIAYNKPPQT